MSVRVRHKGGEEVYTPACGNRREVKRKKKERKKRGKKEKRRREKKGERKEGNLHKEGCLDKTRSYNSIQGMPPKRGPGAKEQLQIS